MSEEKKVKSEKNTKAKKDVEKKEVEKEKKKSSSKSEKSVEKGEKKGKVIKAEKTHKETEKEEKKEIKEVKEVAKQEKKEEKVSPEVEASGGKAVKEIKESKEEKKIEKKEAKQKVKYIPRMRKLYETEAVKALNALYKYSSPMAVPRLVKVVINMGLGDATQDKGVVDAAVEELTIIAGQRAVKTFAKKSISNFHLREGMPIGARVTLRGSRMYDFIDKLVNIALPRVRDFKGLSTSSFDGRGNYTIGLREQLVFPEIDYDKISKVRGMDITIVTTARTDDEAYQLLKNVGFPFKEK